jgi:hypothetical protein
LPTLPITLGTGDGLLLPVSTGEEPALGGGHADATESPALLAPYLAGVEAVAFRADLFAYVFGSVAVLALGHGGRVVRLIVRTVWLDLDGECERCEMGLVRVLTYFWLLFENWSGDMDVTRRLSYLFW